MKNILEVKNLNKKYADFTLKNVSFTLPTGMIMGFIGENGAGKTTTIKAILNIITDYTGEINIMGLNNKTNDQKIKENIGVVLDDMFFPEVLKAQDINQIMKSIYTSWDEELFQNYLKQFNLPLKKAIKTFSKQLLILDEPTSGLDPVARAEVIEIFQNFIQNEKCSILLSSHQTTDLEHIADYITFINKGQIILSATCDEILNHYAIVRCTAAEFKKIKPEDYLKYRQEKYNYELLITNKKSFKQKYTTEVIDKITLDDLMVLMIKGVK